MRDLENLSHCLVEGDKVRVSQWRRRRLGALLISLLIEVLVLSAMVLVPLLATGELPRLLLITPSPPYKGSPHVNQEASPSRSAGHAQKSKARAWDWAFQPPRIPLLIDRADGNGVALPEVGSPGSPDGLVPSMGSVDVRPFVPNPLDSFKPPEPRLRPLRRSEGVQQALLIHRIQPVNPALARQIHLQGTVVLRAIIGRDGTVRAIEVVSGHPLLVQAALEAVCQWRYQPTLLNGAPVEVETHITVIFQLQQ